VPVETCYAIDVNWLQQQGALRPGVHRTIRWSSVDSWGETNHRASIRVAAKLRCIVLKYSTTDYDDNRNEHEHTVPLIWTRCHFGVRRPYFICPGVVNDVSCMRRVAKLYKPPAGSYFLCRHCHNLRYYSCNESGDVHFTAIRQTKRAARKPGLTNPENAYAMKRPKGMHMRTVKRLRQDVIDAMECEHRAYVIVLRNFV
jgi:hypothetical protein